MPYGIVRDDDGKWRVVRKRVGSRPRRTMGKHDTEEAAKRQLAAVQAATGGK